MIQAIAAVAAFAFVAAAIPHTSAVAQESESSLGSRLPPNVRALLIQEMNAILAASHTILEAIVRGQHEVVAEQATLIHDSFILEQQMTPADRMALEEAATPSFIEKDEAFHALSEQLAKAAARSDHPAERRIFAQMLDACADCHAEHASDRFPGVRAEPREAPEGP
jgi:hypothetical protein